MKRGTVNLSAKRKSSRWLGMHSGRTWDASRRRGLPFYALFILLFFFLQTVEARVVDSPLDAYTERKWQMQDGLPEQIVQAFAQTADHYLWIGTTGGLLRFDGASFVLYDRANTPEFRDNNIFCLTVSRDNSLWIGSEGGGLIRYRDGVFRAFSAADGLTNAFVRSVEQDSKGQIWIGTDDGLFRLSGGTVRAYRWQRDRARVGGTCHP